MAKPADSDPHSHTTPARRLSRSFLPGMLHFSRITTLLALLLIAVAAVSIGRDRLTWGIPVGILGVTLAVVAGTLTQSLLIPRIGARLISAQKTLRSVLEDRATLMNQLSELRDDRDDLQRRLLAVESEEARSHPSSGLAERVEKIGSGQPDGSPDAPRTARRDKALAPSGEMAGRDAIVDVAVRLVTATSVEEIHGVVCSVLRDSAPSRLVIVSREGSGDGNFVAVRDMQAYAPETDVAVRVPLMALYPPQLSDLILLGLGLAAPLWVEDLSALDPGLSPELGGALASLWETGICRALVLVPIRAGRGGSAPDGSAIALFRDVHHFEPAERQVHAVLNGVLGMSVVRTRSSADLQARAARQEALSRIGGEIDSSADVASILQVSLRELGRALGASGGEIQVDMAAARAAACGDPGRTPLLPYDDDDGDGGML